MQSKFSGTPSNREPIPLSPENKLIFATGPLTGIGLPNSGKLVIASKSPLTGGYGDGNSGSWAAVNMRKAGYDALVIEGKASKPVTTPHQRPNVGVSGCVRFVGQKYL